MRGKRGGGDGATRSSAPKLTKVYAGSDFPRPSTSLDLVVGPGEIFGLLGPNGAGKTTTAGMLTTRVVPTSGSAYVGGIDVVRHPALAKQILGIVTQQNTLDRQLTVWENLYFHGRLSGSPPGVPARQPTSCSSSSSSTSGPRPRSTPCRAAWPSA